MIISITYKPLDSTKSAPTDGFERVAVDHARLITGYGIEGDRKGGHPRRQLSIMSMRTLENLRAQGYDIRPGALGEQLVIDGVDVDRLPVGTRFRLGETACVEITAHRQGCQKLDQSQGRTGPTPDKPLGVMAKVICDGDIRTGDSVTIVETDALHV